MSELSQIESHTKHELPLDLRDFLKLSQYFEDLSHYDARALETLASDTIHAEDVPRSKKGADRLASERSHNLQEKVTAAHSAVARALTSLAMQDEVKNELLKTMGTESVSYQIAYDHAYELLEEFNEQFSKRCKIVECDRDPSGERARDVAWGLTSHIPNDDAQRAKWKELVHHLERLPGPHRTSFQEYTHDPNAKTVLNLIRSYHSFYPRISHIDFPYSQDDFNNLQTLLRKASALAEHILEKYPLDPSNEPVIETRTSELVASINTSERRPTTERHSYIEFLPHYQELKELFGQNFLGIEEVDRAFTISPQSQGQDADTALESLSDLESIRRNQQNQPREQHLFSFTPDIQRRAIELLTQKLNESDVAQLIQKIRRGEIPRDTFMLVLRRGQFSDGTDVTMQSLAEKLEPSMQQHNQGKLIYNPQPNEPYYTNPDSAIISKGNMEWIFVTKEVVGDTLNKNNAAQTRILDQEARRLGLTTTACRRSKGWEVEYDFVAMLRAHNIRLFTDPYRYDRTSDTSSDGQSLVVGIGHADGLGLGLFGGADSRVGVRLSR